MRHLSLSCAALSLATTLLPCSAGAQQNQDPLQFFVGSTESIGSMRILMRRPYRTNSVGTGVMRADGSLELVQRVMDAGAQQKDRRWLIRQVGPGRFSGTMSEAVGPVYVEEIAGKYRIRLKMKGNLSVEEWVTPDPRGRSATTKLKVRKFGIQVAMSEGIIRKIY